MRSDVLDYLPGDLHVHFEFACSGHIQKSKAGRLLFQCLHKSIYGPTSHLSPQLTTMSDSTNLDLYFHPSRFGPLPDYQAQVSYPIRPFSVFSVLVGLRYLRLPVSDALNDTPLLTTPKYAVFRLSSQDNFHTFRTNVFAWVPSHRTGRAKDRSALGKSEEQR